jgi:thiopeptide-type bacteriocin biosynthesis protein
MGGRRKARLDASLGIGTVSQEAGWQMASRSAHRFDDRFCLRAALLPYERIAPRAEEHALPRGERLAAARERLRALVDEAPVREALFLASASLLADVAHWRESPETQRGRRVERALVKYLTRMATRATPFGLFAGVGVGRIGGNGEATALTVGAEHERRTRIDGEVLWRIARRLESDPAVRGALHFLPNSSLFAAAGELRYAEEREGPGGVEHHLVSVEPTPLLDDALSIARPGIRLAELVAALARGPGRPPEPDVRQFVADLVDAQILVSELGLAVTGAGGLEELQATLSRRGVAAAAELAAIGAELAELDRAGPGLSPERYRAARRLVDRLDPGAEKESRAESHWLQVDTAARVGGVLARDDVDEIARAVAALRIVGRGQKAPALDEFRRAFSERWGTAEVPLAQALDEDVGVGFGGPTRPEQQSAPLVAGLPFPSLAAEPTLPWARREAWLMGRFARAIAAGEREIAIDDADLRAVGPAEPVPLADAHAVRVRIAGSGAILLEGVHGPSGARLLGRFCDTSPAIDALVRDHLAAEEALEPDALFAEVVHLSSGRAANVVSRPVLREAEIIYLGRGAGRVQLGIDDLLVSVRGGRIELRSRELDRRVLPRLTSAHNTRAFGPPIYRFLAALQAQEGGAVRWKWGAFLDAPFLPRVRIGRVVLARASWLLADEELAELRAARGDVDVLAALDRLAERRGLPRQVVLPVADQELFADLDDPLQSLALAHALGRSRPRLLEAFPASADLAARGPGGRHASEIVLLAMREPAGRAERTRPAERDDRSPAERDERGPDRAAVRRFAPGSDWLYVKLHGGPALLDGALRRVVAPVVADLVDPRGARWFFLRYADPAWHVRLRVHGPPGWLLGEVLPAIERRAAPLLDDATLWRVQVDTYEREVERYGGPAGVELAEEIFWRDSQAALAVVAATDGAEDARWQLALRGADRLLEALGLDLERRTRVYAVAREGLAAEYKVDTEFWRAVGVRYREQQATIAELLGPAPAASASGCAALAARDRALAPAGSRLAAIAGDPLERPRAVQYAHSLVHLHFNRVLETAQRPHELVLLDLLGRHGAAVRARLERAGAGAAS